MKPAGHADVPEWELLVDEAGRLTFAHPAQARAYLRGKFAGQTIVGQFYEHRQKRSLRQSRGFHAMVKPWLFCEARGGWQIEHLKLWVLGEVFGYLEMVHPVSGEVIRFPAKPHTSDLKVGEFCELVERTLELAAFEGVILTAPSEYLRQVKAMARKVEREARKGAA